MKIGDKIIYGNEIEKNGNIIISAACDGGTIIAPLEMFKEI